MEAIGSFLLSCHLNAGALMNLKIIPGKRGSGLRDPTLGPQLPVCEMGS